MFSVSPEKVATPLLPVTDECAAQCSLRPGLFASATVTVPLNVDVDSRPQLSSAWTVRPKRGTRDDAGRRLLRDHQLLGGHGDHGDGARRRTAEAVAGDRERVAGPSWSASIRRRWPRRCLPSPKACRRGSLPPGYSPAPPSRRRCHSFPHCRKRPRSPLAGRSRCSTMTLAGGCCVITNCEAAAGVTVMAPVVALSRPLLETRSV